MLVGLLGRSMLVDLARTLMVVNNLTVEKLIAGGLYCAIYNNDKSLVTPYLSQIALHAYISHVRDNVTSTEDDKQLAEELKLALASYTADSNGDRYELSVLSSERLLRVVLVGVQKHFECLLLEGVNLRQCTLEEGLGATDHINVCHKVKTAQFDFSVPFSDQIIHYTEAAKLEKSVVVDQCCYMPMNKQNPGFDSIMLIQDLNGHKYIIALENKFSLPVSWTALNWREDVINKAQNTYKLLRTLGWNDEEIILVVTSWRKVSGSTKDDVIGALSAIPNFIVLTESEQRQRLGATLSAIIDTWSDAGNLVAEGNEKDGEDNMSQPLVSILGKREVNDK